MGYNWDTLLETRGYWVFDEELKEHPRKYLSTKDLLEMRIGKYVPWWLSKEEKANLKMEKAAGASKAEDKSAACLSTLTSWHTGGD